MLLLQNCKCHSVREVFKLGRYTVERAVWSQPLILFQKSKGHEKLGRKETVLNSSRGIFRTSSLFSSTSPSSSSPPSSSASSSNNLDTKTEASKFSTSNNFGQPTSWTHPHLIKDDDLVPGLKVEEFKHRRERLMERVQKHNVLNIDRHELRTHIIIVPSAGKKYMSGKIPYFFRQSSDFYYLTGCLEPDSVLVLITNGKSEKKSILFMRPKDKHAELWDGPRTGVDDSIYLFGVDEAYSVDALKSEIIRRTNIESVSNKPVIWYDYSTSEQMNVSQQLKKIVEEYGFIKSPTDHIERLRLFKSPAEIELMRKTCSIASESINETIRNSKPGDSEHHIQTMVDYGCRIRNASYLAYPPVVAAGANATTIHYINNSQITKEGDLVLMDAGCEYAGYTSDITRTWPISGVFTEPQKVVYDIVLQIEKELIDTMLKEGGETLNRLFDTMCLKLGRYLQEENLISKSIVDPNSIAQAAYVFCPHHVSHYLGLDVHDTPLMSRTLPLLPGMICTVEPGIYIPVDCDSVPKEFRGIGVRIEDDVLITADNTVEVLTDSCFKDRESIEKVM